ncbi:MAG: MFS transporter [Pseudomonadota bacterium]
MTLRTVPLVEAQALPLLRRPFVLLLLMAAAMPIAFSTWSALQVNFAIEAAGFDGKDNGWLHTVREIPGFLAVGVIAVILFMREQVLGLVSLILLGFAVAITAWFPTFEGLLVTTMLSSIGFHYYETVNQSLQLQWLPKDRAPQLIGWLVAMGSAASLVVYGTITFGWEMLGFSYESVYLVGGGLTMVIAFACLLLYPQFESPSPQVKKMVLRRRYWLYYALQFMSGARRQIFIVFAAFMMVEKFGFEVHELTALFLINYVASMIAAPLMGKVVATFGERRALALEYVGLAVIFVSYGALYFADVGDWAWGVTIAAALYVLDHIFFALALALKTYFQKIADPGDIAPTAAVAFTINHIAAVFLPAALGYLWITSPASVFLLAAGMACVSLGLALMIPRHPVPGHETVFSRQAVAAPAE